MSPILEVVAPPALTVTVGAVRLMLTPLTAGGVNVRSASLLAVSRTVPPFRLTGPIAKLPAANTSVAEVIV